MFQDNSYEDEEDSDQCMAASTACVFPFVHEGVTYDECTDVDGTGFKWCATAVDPATQEWKIRTECNCPAAVVASGSVPTTTTHKIKLPSTGMLGLITCFIILWWGFNDLVFSDLKVHYDFVY